MTLESNVFSAVQASNAKTIQEKIRKNTLGLLLLDWKMPGTSGAELISSLKNQEKIRQSPIIILTTKGDDYGYQVLLSKRINSLCESYVATPKKSILTKFLTRTKKCHKKHRHLDRHL